MQFLSKLLGGGASEFIDGVTNAVDEFTLSKEEKQDFKLKMQEYLLKLDERAKASYQEELNTRSEIIKAEMAQGDVFTKRARPTIVYTGLIFIFLVHVILPIVGYFTGDTESLQQLKLPGEFWWAWSTVVGIYGVGRTAEKFGMVNSYTQLATGSGAANVQRGNAPLQAKTPAG
ncbi:holin family protein [Roseimarinus sediminis]|uniref:holin family protein n=1 Tax=Roseimarinus sediminis TaxID=1610899 RepID=UPI003D1BFAA8